MSDSVYATAGRPFPLGARPVDGAVNFALFSRHASAVDLLLSRGVPMLLGGDEFRRSQHGNNNAYCQDNELSWYDWRLIERNSELLRFTREMIALRKRHPVLTAESFYDTGDIAWFDSGGNDPDWGGEERSLGCVLNGGRFDDVELCLLFNAEPHTVEFHPPKARNEQAWRLAVNTAASSPEDVREPNDYLLFDKSSQLILSDRALMVLIG